VLQLEGHDSSDVLAVALLKGGEEKDDEFFCYFERVTKDQIDLRIVFEDPRLVSTTDELDILQIRIA